MDSRGIDRDGDTSLTASVPLAGENTGKATASSQVRQWGSASALSSLPDAIERFLAERPFERMPWLVTAMLCGIAAWFALPGPGEWLILLGVCAGFAGAAMLIRSSRFETSRIAILSVAAMVAVGCAMIWLRSDMVGAEPIAGPRVATIEARVLERIAQPARQRVQIVVATRDPQDGRAIRARLNVSADRDDPRLVAGRMFSARARLIPPQQAIVPGAYDFARTAWFEGYAATGSLLTRPRLIEGAAEEQGLGRTRSALAERVRAAVGKHAEPSAAAIAATLVTGDRGAIGERDARAMRDAGLAHLLSISGLHVGAVVAIAWLIALRGLALWPALALRVTLPLVAATAGAGAAIGYTLLTGAALPTIRACLAALLVLLALAIGRQALSMRLVALAALAVMLFWPEAVLGPSFQLSFAAVAAIVALHNAAPMQRLRERSGQGRGGRFRLAFLTLLLTGIVVELTLLPLVLHHFHRAGIYGAMANLAAIPLTTLVIMPALGLGLLLDLVGVGAPAFWIAGLALDWLLWIARVVSASPGAVVTLPVVPTAGLLAFAAGGLWLALWSGRIRLLGLIPVGLGLVLYATARPPDLMVSGDARHVVLFDGRHSYFLRPRDSFARDALLELSGLPREEADARVRDLTRWPGAECNRDFCRVHAAAGDTSRTLLIARRRADVDADTLAAACAAADIVIAPQRLPQSCAPRLLKADSVLLSRRGGLAMDLESGAIRYVRPAGDRHGW